jgi:NADH dehydrogenase FAD-containing subunit
VVIVGGGWGGLAAARRLRRLAPELEVTLVERDAGFRSLPLSNAWLVGLAHRAPPRRTCDDLPPPWATATCGPR